MRYFISIFLVIPMTLVLGLAACNTMEGAGKDVKSAGENLENSANEHRYY